MLGGDQRFPRRRRGRQHRGRNGARGRRRGRSLVLGKIGEDGDAEPPRRPSCATRADDGASARAGVRPSGRTRHPRRRRPRSPLACPSLTRSPHRNHVLPYQQRRGRRLSVGSVNQPLPPRERRRSQTTVQRDLLTERRCLMCFCWTEPQERGSGWTMAMTLLTHTTSKTKTVMAAKTAATAGKTAA